MQSAARRPYTHRACAAFVPFPPPLVRQPPARRGEGGFFCCDPIAVLAVGWTVLAVSADEQVTAIVVSYNSAVHLPGCVAALLRDPAVAEVLVIDNCSADGSLSCLDVVRDTRLRIVALPTNDGYAAAVNAGVQMSTAPLLFVCNPDLTVTDGCVSLLAAHVAACGGVAGPVLDVDAAGGQEWGAVANRIAMPHQMRQADHAPLWVAGAAMMLPRQLWNRLSGMDERLFLFGEDVELCARALAVGEPVHVLPQARAWHVGGASIPGGYDDACGPVTTSALRISLRERNMLAVALGCWPARLLPLVVPVIAVRILLSAAAAAILLRRPSLGWALLRALSWNVVQLPATLARRRSLPGADYQRVGARLTHTPYLTRLFLSRGLPRLIDTTKASA